MRKSKEFPIQNITVPVALFTAKGDLMTTLEDVAWTRKQMENTIIYYKEIDGGHATFLVGLDMTYFTVDVMDLLRMYMPLPLP